MNLSPLKVERERHGWSQHELAQKLGVGVSTVARWEQGKAVPYPYHRKRLAALFGKTPQQLGLLSDIDEQEQVLSIDLQSEAAPEADPLTDLAIPQVEDSTKIDGLVRHLSPQWLWNGSPGSIKRVSTFRLLNLFSWHHLLIFLTILLAVVVIMADLQGFSHLSWPGLGQHSASSSSKNSGQDMYSPSSYSLLISNANPSLQDIVQRLQHAFNAVFPQLVNRFARDAAVTARQTVTLTFASNLSSPASISGTTIRLDAGWMREHPSQIGIFTHALASVVQAYPRGVPVWFADGMADYARSLYGPADDEWSVPNGVQPHQGYTQGGAIAARFLVWLEQNTIPNLVDQLNYALQRGQDFSVVFHRLTRHTVDELWSQYQAQPDITLIPQHFYNIATNRKPLCQSSFRIQRPKLPDWPVDAEQRGLVDTIVSQEVQGLYLSNFAMQVDITILQGGAGGLYFRNQSHANYYAVVLSSDGRYDLWYKAQSQATASSLTSDFSPAIRQGPNRTNRLTIVAYKHTFSLYINSQFVIQVEDNTSSYGTAELMTFVGKEPADVRFDNLQVF